MSGANKQILPSNEEKPLFVNSMFARIAPTYDRMNRLMAMGQDQSWRREMLAYCNLLPRGTLLDIGTGTGDIAYEAMRLYPGIQAYGADFTYEMMAAGVGREPGLALPYTQADTYHLPYADNTFDAVVSGFMVRNLVDRTAAFREQARVAKPGGRVVCLEITPPDNTILGPLFQLYFFRIVPIIGGLISGDREAYAYLPQSTVNFPAPTKLAHIMEMAGLRNVVYHERMMGTVAIHVGMKL
ncbi:MAG: ubiquinone/menaquinone biosynthesis methyltransferase [Caldilineaceae bacterium]|nr:ubiquinone/menaquinone biosynthesis methyltransferase [Caldilineaceae bacterium]